MWSILSILNPPHPTITILHPHRPALSPCCGLVVRLLSPCCTLAVLFPRTCCALAAPLLGPCCALAGPLLCPWSIHYCALAAPLLRPVQPHCIYITIQCAINMLLRFMCWSKGIPEKEIHCRWGGTDQWAINGQGHIKRLSNGQSTG